LLVLRCQKIITHDQQNNKHYSQHQQDNKGATERNVVKPTNWRIKKKQEAAVSRSPQLSGM